MSSSSSSTTTMWARIRLADVRDVPIIHRLIHQMAEFELLTDLFSATESSLATTLFPSPPLTPFRSFTVLILELSPKPITITITINNDNDENFSDVVNRIELGSPVSDPEPDTFASPRGDGLVVAGYVLCFPNYPSFLAKPGLYVEGIFVREAWRRKGLGRMMLSAVVAQAAKMGYGRVEWCVLDWNQNAIDLYKQMGADVIPMLRICRLAGENLQKYAVAADDAN